jgi:hypothetical protein
LGGWQSCCYAELIDSSNRGCVASVVTVGTVVGVVVKLCRADAMPIPVTALTVGAVVGLVAELLLC